MNQMNSRDILAEVDLFSNAQGIDRYTALMRVLLGHLHHLPAPPTFVPLLEVVHVYWETERGDADALLGAKAKCWEFLKPIPFHQHLDTPETRFARGVLCVLDPRGDENDEEMLHDTAEWFATAVWGTF